MVKELSALGGLGDSILRGLRQPEYVHVLLNPLPVYGLLVAWIGLLIAFFSKSRRAQIAALVLVLISSLSAWPVYEFGQQGYDRVLSMTSRISQRTSAAEEIGTPGLDRECKARNAKVIPSEVEESRGIIEWSHHGILRLRGAPLRMTAKERFNPSMLE
jgi:hypothetical protein